MSKEAIEGAILTQLSASSIDDTFPWADENKFDHLVVVGVVKSLQVEGYVAVENLATSFYKLSAEADSILKDGSQEIIVLKCLIENGKMGIPALQEAVGKNIAKVGMGNCMKKKWIKKDGGDLVPVKEMSEVQDEVQLALVALTEGNFAEDAIDGKVSIAKSTCLCLSEFFLSHSSQHTCCVHTSRYCFYHSSLLLFCIDR